MPVAPDIPSIDEMIADLRILRERGLVRLRHTDLAAIGRAAQRPDLDAVASGAGAAEALLRAAVDNLGGGSLGQAAMATFGLSRGARDQAAQDRRRRAALVYGVSVERFRKHHERVVLEQVAEEILKLCLAPPAGRVVMAPAEFGHQIRRTGQLGGLHFPVVVHIEPVELLSCVDIIVVPENIYFELPQHFKSSISAAVRRAAATRSPDGEVLADVVADELRSWVHSHGRAGLPVAPGTVAATSPGEMASQGIRRIYHAATASPLPGTNSYQVEPTAIVTAVRNVMALARSDPLLPEQAPRSLAFPLLGAGRGGLAPGTSFSWLWAAIDRDMRSNGPQEIHFITRRQALADLIVNGLGELDVLTPEQR
jgi:hypothetical protein